MRVTVTAHTGWTNPVTFTVPTNRNAIFEALSPRQQAEAIWTAIESPWPIRESSLASGQAAFVQEHVNKARASGTRFFGMVPGDTIFIVSNRHIAECTVEPTGWTVRTPAQRSTP